MLPIILFDLKIGSPNSINMTGMNSNIISNIYNS